MTEHKTDAQVDQWLDNLDAKAREGEAPDVDPLSTVLHDLVRACRAAHVTAADSAADAVDIITQVLAKHELLPPDPDDEEPCEWTVKVMFPTDQMAVIRVQAVDLQEAMAAALVEAPLDSQVYECLPTDREEQARRVGMIHKGEIIATA